MELSWTKFSSCIRRAKRMMTSIRDHPQNSPPDVSWEDLPEELLSSIVDKLTIVELLGFRGVCKSWRASASLATAEVESSPDRNPWLLVHRDGEPRCLLLNDKHQKHYMTIPELEDTTCIASSQGWLLVTKQESIFFFCPLSRSRIDLPPLPLTPADQVGAFSSLPTSEDCVVCVPNRDKDSGLELLVLSRGEHQWTKHELGSLYRGVEALTSASFHEGVFCFRDRGDGFVTFRPRDNEKMRYRVLMQAHATSSKMPFSYRVSGAKDYEEDIKAWLGSEDHVSVATCGTVVLRSVKPDTVLMNDTADSGLTGVWLHPRFFQLPQDQTW